MSEGSVPSFVAQSANADVRGALYDLFLAVGFEHSDGTSITRSTATRRAMEQAAVVLGDSVAAMVSEWQEKLAARPERSEGAQTRNKSGAGLVVGEDQ